MNSNDFIGIYEDVLTKDQCKTIIEEFEHRYLNCSSTNRPQNNGDLMRKDQFLFANDGLYNTFAIVNPALQKCIDLYVEEYFILKQINAISMEMKVQKTFPRGGYHQWHCEAGTSDSSRRCLAWMIYLNTFPDGEGETEFLWQGKRIKPVAGTCVMWPAAWTHTHRGNPVYSHDKYIVTGWYTHNG